MAERNAPLARHSGPSTESAARLNEDSLAANRLVSLLGRIRDGARETLDAIQSKEFYGSLDEVFPVYHEDVSVAVSYLVKFGVSHEEARQLQREYGRAWDAGGVLQGLMRNPPIVINYPASDDDPDDPEVARVKHVNAERSAEHQRKVDDQRGTAVDAFSALSKRVDDLVEAIESMRSGDDEEAPVHPSCPVLDSQFPADMSSNPMVQARDATQSESSVGSLTGFLGGADLADAMGIHPTRRDAFFRQLERQRQSLGDDCWHEVCEPRPNSPRFLYRVDSPKLRDLATAYKAPKPA